MEQPGPRQWFMPKQARTIDLAMFRTCGLLEQNGCATLMQGDYTWALPRTHWIWVTGWSKPERLIQRQLCFLFCFVLFLHTAKQMCTYIFLGEDSSGIVLWMDTWKLGKWASPGSHVPFTALQAAGKPKAGIRRTGFWVRQSWPWILPSSTGYSVTLGTGKEPNNTTYTMVVRRIKWDNAGKILNCCI